MYTRFLPILMLVAVLGGCGRSGVIEVDTTTRPVRFIVDHQGWPRPFAFPNVTEFAVASEEDGLLWQLESTSSEGAPADNLAFIYGAAPNGFRQIHPYENKAPKRLVSNRTYFVAATGPNAVYRVAFALPQRAEDIRLRRRGDREDTTDRRGPDGGGFYPADPPQTPVDAPSGG